MENNQPETSSGKPASAHSKVPKKVKWLLAGIGFAYLCLFAAGQTYFQKVENMQWLLYYDSSYEVSLADEEGKPLAGALVVALWPLDSMPGEGYGGYAKIILETTDKEGKAHIPGWVKFSPFSFFTATHWLAPRLVFYKPAYNVTRRTGEQMRKKESFPVKLTRANTNEALWQAYNDFGTAAGFPSDSPDSTFYSNKQLRFIFDYVTKETNQIPRNMNKAKRTILELNKNYQRFWVEGKR